MSELLDLFFLNYSYEETRKDPFTIYIASQQDAETLKSRKGA